MLVVYYAIEFPLPIWACLSVIALSAWLNVALRVRFSLTQRLEPERAAWLLAFDIAELAVLLFLTGGLENPFAFLFLAPVLLSATALPPRITIMLGVFAVLCATVLVFVHYPLPWDADDPLELPWIYLLGVWLSILLAIGFIGVYAWQITEESRQIAEALAATELVLAREQHLSQLDGLAAAAAHELGTPLSTISVIVKELELALDPNSPHIDDVRLLHEQSQRCRDILAKLTELSTGEPFDRMPLSALIEEVVAPHRNFGIAIDVALQHDAAPPMGARNPAILYGLGNLLENAVDFAQEPRRSHRGLERRGCRRHHQRRRPGLRARGHGPDRRALCAIKQAPPHECRQRNHRPGPWILHRQDLAGTLGRQRRFREPQLSGPWSGDPGPLGAQRFRAAARVRRHLRLMAMFPRLNAHEPGNDRHSARGRPDRAHAADRGGRQVLPAAAGARHGGARL